MCSHHVPRHTSLWPRQVTIAIAAGLMVNWAIKGQMKVGKVARNYKLESVHNEPPMTMDNKTKTTYGLDCHLFSDPHLHGLRTICTDRLARKTSFGFTFVMYPRIC